MPNSTWMNGFTNRQNLTLADLTIPASHDAGVSEAHNQRYDYRLGPEASTVAQYTDILGQLDAGSRFFDLRIAPDNGVLKTFHGGAAGRWGQRADLIFQQVNGFLTANTGEIVILRISHTKASANVGACVTANINAARLCCLGPRNLTRTPLPSLRGKAIVIFDEDALPNTSPYTGLQRFTKYSPGTLVGEGLTICGSYGGIWADLREMAQTAVRCGNAHGTHPRNGGPHDHLFMIYWQLAFNIKEKTILGNNQRSIAALTRINDNQGVHFNLDYILNAHRGCFAMHRVSFRAKKLLKISKTVETTNVTVNNRRWHRPNIINLDFVDEEVCNRVIAFNNFLLNNP